MEKNMQRSKPNQVDQLQEAFQRFDQDRDGLLSLQELGAAMQSVGCQRTNDNQLREILKAQNIDGSRGVDLSMFAQIVTGKQDETEEELLEAFRSFDSEGQGYLRYDEIEAVLQSGGQLTKDEVEQLMNDAGVSLEGDKLNYEEFISKTLKK